jgi:Cu(I)/Ag(I) efflux system membrane fusion protein
MSRAGGSRILVALLLFATGGLVLVGGEQRRRLRESIESWLGADRSEHEERFWCPMDPQIVRVGPGMCPICNMELVVFEGGGVGADPGVLQLTDRQVQQAGVRIGSAEVRDLVREVHTVGRLVVHPANRRTVSLELPGESRVERLLVQSAGEKVSEGQVLVELGNDTMSGFMEDYRAVLRELGELRRQNRMEELKPRLGELKALRERLDRPGIPRRHIDNLASQPRYQFDDLVFPIVSPIDGVLLEDPTIEKGLFVREKTVLFRIADLSKLWLQVDLFETERALVDVGSQVEFWTYAVPDETFRATVEFIEPVVRERTQTARARCRVFNQDGKLAPGTVVRASILSDIAGVLSVPESAVLQSGLRDVVLVAEGSGQFRPRTVRLGRRHLYLVRDEDDTGAFDPRDVRFHEITSGLRAGDRVVVAGNFLLNAEAQFQGILSKMYAAAEVEGPVLPAGSQEDVDSILAVYFDVGRALVSDDSQALEDLGPALSAPASALRRADGLDPLFGRLAEAALALAADARAGVDLEEVRKRYGGLSREVVAYLRDCAPLRVAEGELFVFRCPMAEPYGFELWVQDEDGLSNPYMGQSMPDCGVPAGLR